MQAKVVNLLNHFQVELVSPQRRLVFVILAIIISLLTSGVIYGFASILLVWKHERVYSHLCGNSTQLEDGQTATSCVPQEIRLNLVYTSGMFLNFVATPAIGFLLDWQGSRRFFLSAVGFFLLGCALFAAANDSSFDSYIPASMIFTTAGTALFLPLVPFAELFPEKMGTIMAFLNVAFDSSSFVFYLFYVLHFSAGLSSSFMFGTFGVVVGALVLIFGLIWPKGVGKNSTESKPPPAPTPSEPIENGHSNGDSVPLDEVEATPAPKAADEFGPPMGVLESLPLLELAKKPEYILFLLFHITNIMWITYYPSTVQQRLLFLAPDAGDQVEQLVSILTITMFGIFIVVPGVGYLIERTGAIISFIIVVINQIVWTLLMFLPTIWPHIITFIVFALGRALYFSVVFVYLAKMFGYSNFGRIWGVTVLCAAPFPLLQNVLLNFTLNSLGGDFKFLSSLQGITFVLSLAFPLYLHVNKHKYSSVTGL